MVITGIGLVTPLGVGRQTTWAALCAGKSAAGPIKQFDARNWPVNFACEVPPFLLSPNAALKHQVPSLNRPNTFALEAAFEAMTDANLSGDDTGASDRLGISVGTGIGTIRPQDIVRILSGHDMNDGADKLAAFLEQGTSGSDLAAMNHPALLAALLAERWGADAYASTFTTACAASSQAVGYGMRAIVQDDADIVLSGGADSLAGELLLAGFCLLGVLSQRKNSPETASRPFDKKRDGLVAGEGAAMLVLEEREHALKRGAHIYAEIKGYGESENAYRITDLPEDGKGAIRSMSAALADAGLTPADIEHINAHGTSTEQNDRVEALAIEQVFYESGSAPVITASKSQIGHFVAAAGAVEAAIAVLSLVHQCVPPTLNLEEPLTGKTHTLRFATTCTKQPMRYVLSNSFGFGGTNASLIFGASHD